MFNNAVEVFNFRTSCTLAEIRKGLILYSDINAFFFVYKIDSLIRRMFFNLLRPITLIKEKGDTVVSSNRSVNINSKALIIGQTFYDTTCLTTVVRVK